MTTLTLTHPDGTVTEHTIKSSWADVTITEFAAYHAAIAGLKPVRQLLEAACHLSTIPRHVLAGNIALCKRVLDLCPWVKEEPVPDTDVPITDFEWRGVAYRYVGSFDTISVGRYEGLVNYLELAGSTPMQAVPQLVALLYASYDRRNEEPTQEVVDVTAAALADAPVPLIYAAVRGFFLRSSRSLLSTQRFIAARADAERAVMELETMMRQASARPSTGLWSRLRMGVLRACLHSVKSRLRMF